MIQKVIHIQNVGKLVDCRPSTTNWNGELAKRTLVYADNGAGKTTLSAVLTSLATNNPALIVGRQTLGGVAGASAQLRVNGTTCSFAGGSWQGCSVRAEVFDSGFIARNVHAGYHVTREHKQSLCEFCLGEEGVRLARKIDDADGKMRKLDLSISQAKLAIKPHVLGATDIDAFVALTLDSDIEAKIAIQRSVLSRVENAEALNKQAMLTEVAIPEVERAQLDAHLSAGFENVLEATAELVRKHVTQTLDVDGESWLAYGVEHAKDNRCPFCGQDTSASDLVQAYKGYFGEAYKLFRDKLETAATAMESAVSTERRASVVEVLLTNLRHWDFWKQHVSTTPPEIERDTLESTWSRYASALAEALTRKSRAPLVAGVLRVPEQSALADFEKLRSQLQSYNDAVKRANAAINQLQKDARTGDPDKERASLQGLQNRERRHSSGVADLCKDYAELVVTKEKLATTKQGLMQDLTHYTDSFSDAFEEKVNEYLSRLCADFSIARSSKKLVNYIGRKPNLDYCLKIRNVTVPLGTRDSPDDTPSFKNTVSEGDKGTLAFALFLAKVNALPDLADVVLVFDDPINSFDADRKTATVSELRRLAGRADQTIILTHDKRFARHVWESIPEVLPLHLPRDGAGRVIAKWDIETETADLYDQDYRAVADFATTETGDKLATVRRLRQLLEGNLRARYVMEFPPRDWLGGMIERIKNARESSRLVAMRQGNRLHELEDINEFCKRFYHDDWSQTVGTPTDNELTSFAERTLAFCGS